MMPNWPKDQPLRVLVVDDSADMTDTTASLLKLWGYEARGAYTGLNALAEAATFLPDVALVDLVLPGMDGYQLAVRLQEQASGRRFVVVALTGLGSDADRHRSERAGFAYHLLKPVIPATLRRVCQALAAWRAEQL
jgi:two-component system CheB/CheR fusion protein